MGEPIKPVAWQRRHGCNTPWIVANAEYVAFYRSVGQEIRQLYDIDPNEAASSIAELEAKLATAVGALERLITAHELSFEFGRTLDEVEAVIAANEDLITARQALASIQERT